MGINLTASEGPPAAKKAKQEEHQTVMVEKVNMCSIILGRYVLP